jgi:hypothetical protein
MPVVQNDLIVAADVRAALAMPTGGIIQMAAQTNPAGYLYAMVRKCPGRTT